MATLYTSESDRLFRYTDEGETVELCKWTVDISSLPSFQENAGIQPNGFYTGMSESFARDAPMVCGAKTESDFELGLELDSAEVRGILLYEGTEWGRVVFDFLA